MTVSISTDPSDLCQRASVAITRAKREREPPKYPTPSERSKKSAKVVPARVVRVIVV